MNRPLPYLLGPEAAMALLTPIAAMAFVSAVALGIYVGVSSLFNR